MCDLVGQNRLYYFLLQAIQPRDSYLSMTVMPSNCCLWMARDFTLLFSFGLLWFFFPPWYLICVFPQPTTNKQFLRECCIWLWTNIPFQIWLHRICLTLPSLLVFLHKPNCHLMPCCTPPSKNKTAEKESQKKLATLTHLTFGILHWTPCF